MMAGAPANILHFSILIPLDHSEWTELGLGCPWLSWTPRREKPGQRLFDFCMFEEIPLNVYVFRTPSPEPLVGIGVIEFCVSCTRVFPCFCKC